MDLEGLFHQRESADEIFYFESISICTFEQSAAASAHTEIEFQYSFCSEIEFQSRLTLKGAVSERNRASIFAIGM